MVNDSYKQMKEGIHMNKPKPHVPENVTPSPYWKLDGVTHINTHYNDSKEPLGKMLAPWAVYPFKHPYFGPFKTIEGFWHFLRSGCVDDRFRSLNGHRAKKRMKDGLQRGTHVKVQLPPDIDHIMLLAHYAKIDQNPVIKEALIASTLPFDQYFLYDNKLIIRPDDTETLVKTLEELRRMFKEGIVPGEYDYSHIRVNK